MFEYSVFSILTGSIIGFIAGSSLTWTSPELVNMNSTEFSSPFHGELTDNAASWISGIVSLAAAHGPFIFGYLADRIGRKYTLLAISVPFGVSSVISAFANTVSEFLVARALTGIGVGGAFTLLPIYVGELSLNDHRATLSSTMNVFICTGLFFTYVAGYYISSVMYFNLLLAGLAGAFFVGFLLVGTETPHYYVQKKKLDLAKRVLTRIRKASDDAIEKELELIRGEIESVERGTIMDIFRSKATTKAFVIGAGLVFFQQMSGINAVLFFAQDIFKQSGTTLAAAYCSMIIGGVQFGTSFITPVISNMFGRKTLLAFSGVGMCLSESVLGVYEIIQDNHPDAVSSLGFIPIVALVMYIITYNMGYGPLAWAVIGEIFPTNVRSSASALATAVCWVTSFVITKWFTQVVAALGQGQCFLGFAGFSLTAAMFAIFVVMETKGKSLTEIQMDLNK